jgi:L-amino acid N-acyltransferase
MPPNSPPPSSPAGPGTNAGTAATAADPLERRRLPSPYTVRLAHLDDADAIRAIYNREVTESTATLDLVPRSAPEQSRWMDDHSGAYAALVAVAPDGSVAGFGSLSPYRTRPGYSTTVEDSVYVRTPHRGAGVGRLLLSELVGVAATSGFHTVIARISAPQEPSLALHRSCGFELVGVEREVARKFGRWVDVALMQRLL